MKQVQKRWPLLDFLRGFALINMLAYHGLYDYFVVYGHNSRWFYAPAINCWQELGLGLFIIVSGMTYGLIHDKRRWQQVLRLQALGLIVTIATVVFMPSEAIYYGVLTFFGSIILVTLLLENSRYQLLSKVNPYGGLLLSLLAYCLTLPTEAGYCGIGAFKLFSWPRFLYQDSFAILGFTGSSFTSSDYVPLLPYGFLFWAGFYLWPLLNNHCPLVLKLGPCGWLKWLGQRSLLVYVLHQPLLLLVFEAVALLFTN